MDSFRKTSSLDVILIEDDRPTRMLLERMIRSRGHEVVAMDSAEAAIEQMRTRYFPLVMLDIQLPGMSGLELTQYLREQEDGGYFYILVGTGNNRPEDLRKILDAGADDYIAKPYNPALLDVRLSVAEASVKAIERRRELEGELTFLAKHDPLTRLSNRNELTPALNEAIEAASEGRPSAVLYLDLDNFKIINDTLGHKTGDQLLIQVADSLLRSTRSTDRLVRFGGDEFVIILRDCAPENAMKAAESLRERIEQIVFAGKDRTFQVGASIGVALVREESTAETVMGEADSACYTAKSRGRGRVATYESESGEIARLIADTDWSTRIREAMRDGSLQLYYQPIIAIPDRKILCQEALLRFVDPELGQAISPQVFLSSVQRSGLMERLDRFVIGQAFEIMSQDKELTLSINVTGQTLGSDGFAGFVEMLSEHLEVRPDRVFFEITEDEMITNLQSAGHVIERLKIRGFQFSLDDFGKGFSSLTHLKNLPIDILKIEGTFIEDLPNQPFNQATLKAVKLIADATGVQTVAEFVETQDEWDMLKDIGISYAQGHFIASARDTPFRQDELR